MRSHLVNLLVFSFLVATVFATLLRDTHPRAPALRRCCAFAAFVLSTLVIGWITNPFPR